MSELKRITKQGVPAAIQKAERYRFLNQAWAAESICLDVIAVDPDNQAALIILLLAITDQFGEGLAEGVERARAILPQLKDPYKRAYYTGIICERRGKAQLDRGAPGAGEMAYDWFKQAMDWYEKAEALRPAENDEAVLRWNTCVRLLSSHHELQPQAERGFEPALED
jgi:hypothetical protein